GGARRADCRFSRDGDASGRAGRPSDTSRHTPGRCLHQPCGGAHGPMTSERTYLDWNATAPLLPEAQAAIVRALDVCGNPSSVHAEGRHARAIVETAREQFAALVGAQPSEVVFTSGATEACNTVLAAPWAAIVVA